MHGHIFIILKESLKYVPILGWGMQFFSFIFLSRNWTKDRERFSHRLTKLKRPQESGVGSGKVTTYNPMWMLMFPEGTNLSPNGRKKSKAWAEKQGIKDTEHVLLPRSTGLKFCLDELAGTVEWVYDCTLAYEGIPYVSQPTENICAA
jgi:1-acyl-sn-glycerol-3-phosphate acyltransferase